MSYNNNKKNLITVKVTAKGREKIATGNLNLDKWSVGDSEINYVREDYLVDNNITNKPSRILKAVDQQPNLKYYITNENGDIRNQLNTGDISVLKLITNNNTTERGFYNINDVTINASLTKALGTFDATAFNNNIITGNYVGASIGDIILLTNKYDATITYENMLYYVVTNVSGTSITVNRELPKRTSGTFSYYVFFSGEVEDVNRWNTEVNFQWNGDVLDYDMQMPLNSNYGTKVWNFNIITMENIAGYYGKEQTLGYEFIGLMENYLSYNDSMNVDGEVIDNFCSNELADGEVDKYQKKIGVIHFTNNNYSNLYGDVFYIDPSKGKNVRLKIPHVIHHKAPSSSTELNAIGVKQNILDSDIEYYDLAIGTVVVGKVLPQYKVFIIEDEELLMAMSLGSGRNFTLPTINTQLTPSITPEGILPNGKQMYITYSICNNVRDSINAKSIHCDKYNVIVNSTPTTKNVTLSFKTEDTNLFYGFSESVAMIQSFRVVYQITDIGARPNHLNWKEVNLSGFLGITDTGFVSNSNIIRNMKFDLTKDHDNTSIQYDLTNDMLLNNNIGLVGNETFLVGNLIASVSSNIYRSIISINVNPNVFVKTTNPTYKDVQGVKPYIAISEIGIYDKDDDLVMIGKLTKPQNLLNNSTIKIDLGLDF